MTNNLLRRVWENNQGEIEGFTKRYTMSRLVYFEEAPDSLAAIRREQQIKRWLRSEKIALVQKINPRPVDLAADWLDSNALRQGSRGDIVRVAKCVKDSSLRSE